MELPSHLKTLYKHWSEHTVAHPKDITGVPRELAWFVGERMDIWEHRTLGHQAPYTKDSIMAQYRFCNIFRELDRQTIEIHTMLNPLRGDFPLWLMNMFFARMVARPSTLRDVGLLSFDKKQNALVYKKLCAHSTPTYGTPYVFPISVIQRSPTPTREAFVTKHVPAIIERVAQEIQSWDKKSVYDGVEKVLPLFKFRFHFLWTEVLIDVAYQFPEYIDLFQRFPIGPGSAPTFQKLSPKEDPSVFVQKLAAKNYTASLTFRGKPLRLSAENWEGVGCEFRKYTNLTAGHGRRRIYKKAGPA